MKIEIFRTALATQLFVTNDDFAILNRTDLAPVFRTSKEGVQYFLLFDLSASSEAGGWQLFGAHGASYKRIPVKPE